MAEVVGVVASSIAIATLAAKVVKLRDCWEQIQDAPADISTLLRQIECFNTLVSQIQAGPRMPDLVFDNSCLIQSLSLCEEGINELTELVNELDGKIRDKGGWRKKLGGAKVVLKKDDLKRAKSRMKSAIQLLSLAHQCHTAAMIQLQPEIIVARVAHHLQSSAANQDLSDATIELVRNDQEEPPNSKPQDLITRQYDTWISSTPWMRFLLGSFEYHSRARIQKGKPRHEYEMKYKFPCWVSQTALHVRGYNYLSQRGINYRAYRIMPWSSPFFRAIRDGDIQTVQRMTVDKSAFLTDRCHLHGDTVLHMAVYAGEVEMCRLLLNEGVDPTQTNKYDSTPLDVLLEHSGNLAFYNQKQPLDVYQLLLNSAAINQIHETDEEVWFLMGPIAMFKNIQNQIYPPYYQRTVGERMMWASEICQSSGWYSNGPKLVDLALDLDGIVTSEMAAWADTEDGRTLLHSLAGALAYSYKVYTGDIDDDLDRTHRELVEASPILVHDGVHYQDCTGMWTPLIRRFLQAGADVHALNLKLQTPLWTLFDLMDVLGDYDELQTRRAILSILVTWLTAFYESGMNLQQYGEKEKELGTFEFSKYYYLNYRTGGVVGIAFGPHPSDWRFWWAEPTDEYAGDFWELIEEDGLWEPESDLSEEEELEQAIPGAWEDDDEED